MLALPREDVVARTRLALHRTILIVDVERFGDLDRTNTDQVVVRAALYRILRHALRRSGVAWDLCHHEDRGDGVLVLAPAETPKSPFVDVLPRALVSALRKHNTGQRAAQQIRLRVALHAGEVNFDDHGVTAVSINFAFRLLDAPPLKQALRESPGVLALIASSWFFDEVIRHSATGDAFHPVRVAVKETTAVGWVCLPDHPFPVNVPESADEQPVTVPRQLPAGTRHFTGRLPELDALTAVLTDNTGSPAVVVSAIDGTAGIGKTALALHWAHRVADRFPDGQLYVNLRGFDPSGPPVAPADAIRAFLDAFEVPAERIPVGLPAQANLYRSLIAGRRMLLVLDNARDSDQVRPLLPGSPGCLVIVTSRNSLTSLIAAEGAYPLTVDLLSANESEELLGRRAGRQRVAAEPEAVKDIITACARLPLALTIVAARAATHPRFPLAALAEQLGSTRNRLDVLDGGDVATNLRAVLSWSYLGLSSAAARLFRLLALHPGPHVTTPAAASVAGLPVERIRPPLAELVRAHLLSERTPDVFVCHDLLREYARERACESDSEEDRSAAIHRMLDHYLHTAYAVAQQVHSRVDGLVMKPPKDGATVCQFPDHEAAASWCENEHAVLLAAIQLAAATGHRKHAWQLAWALSEYFDRLGHWHDLSTIQRTALTAATASDDLEGRAISHRGVGRAYLRSGQDDHALEHLTMALRLYAKLGNLVGQAHVHVEFGWILARQGRPLKALHHLERTLVLSRAVNSRLGQCRALNSIGWCHALLGNAHHAIMYCRHGLLRYRELGDPTGEAYSLHNLGYAHHQLGHYNRAIAYYQQSLAVEHARKDPYRRAMVLANLGDSHRVNGDEAAAREAWCEALDALHQLGNPSGTGRGYPDAQEIKAKLAG